MQSSMHEGLSPNARQYWSELQTELRNRKDLNSTAKWRMRSFLQGNTD